MYQIQFHSESLHMNVNLAVIHVYVFVRDLAERERGAWSLVCESEEQWARLADSIKDKSSPQDRHLYRIISQNFLPEISNMIEHKVSLFSHKYLFN